MSACRKHLVFASSLGLLACALACGGSSSPGTSTQGSGGGGTGTNTAAVTVSAGPAGNYVNGGFVDVEVCVPGSNTNCTTVNGVLLDTGSVGLRLLDSALGSLQLPKTTSNGLALGNCVQYVDLSYNWGPVVTADVKMAGETAGSVPIQIISSSTATFPNAPSACSNGGTAANTLASLGANGILGVGFFLQDCGPACAPGSGGTPNVYYACSLSSSNCSATQVALAQQVANPVAFFPHDNNGIKISLPAISASGAPSVAGTLTFGIGTQSDNALGGASVLMPDAFGEITTVFNGQSYSSSFIDSGSNALFFLDSAVTGIPTCSGSAFFYCPGSMQSLTAQNRGANGTSTTVNFSVVSERSLSGANTAFDDLAGPSFTGSGSPSLYFDWGLPFFFGRSVFIAIEQRSTSGGTGPYVAY